MPQWRDEPDRAADDLIVSSLSDLALPGANARALLVDAGLRLSATLQETNKVMQIDRRASALVPAPIHAPPTDDPLAFAAAFVRLPKSKSELEFTTHRLMPWLAPDCKIYIYGGNDEGIRSVPKRLAALGSKIETVAAHSHGRILALQRPRDLTHVETRDEQWRTTTNVDLGDGTTRPWVSYPGLFASGKLDAATAFLLAHVPMMQPGARALDYGCGTGIIARALLDRDPAAKVAAVDADIFALMATAENAPAAKTTLGYRLKDSGRHDLIISNPPIHNGFREDHTSLHQMIEDAPMHLLPNGKLLFVVQRRVPVEAQLKAQFQDIEIVADRGPFRIWSASQPIKQTGIRQPSRKDSGAKDSGPKVPLTYGDIEIGDEVEEW